MPDPVLVMVLGARFRVADISRLFINLFAHLCDPPVERNPQFGQL